MAYQMGQGWTQQDTIRVKDYDFNYWIQRGYRLWDYDFESGESILAPFDNPPLSVQEARGQRNPDGSYE